MNSILGRAVVGGQGGAQRGSGTFSGAIKQIASIMSQNYVCFWEKRIDVFAVRLREISGR